MLVRCHECPRRELADYETLIAWGWTTKHTHPHGRACEKCDVSGEWRCPEHSPRPSEAATPDVASPAVE